jgi:mRNA interferase RelE/StbE
MYSIKWEERALTELEKLEKSVSIRIFNKIDRLRENINSSDIKRLKASDKFRLRVGDYRVIFSVEGSLIIIWKVGHRKNVYDSF